MKYLYILLVFIPVTIAGKIMGFSDPMLFVFSSLAIIPLAGVMGKSTDDIAGYCGQRIGGLLNATFGNATELIIAFVAMKEGLFDVVKASLAGSVIGNILLVLGMSMLAGGIKHKTQTFNRGSINITSSMLLFAVLVLCYTCASAVSPFINSMAFIYVKEGITINYGLGRGMGSASFGLASLLVGRLWSSFGKAFVPYYVAIMPL